MSEAHIQMSSTVSQWVLIAAAVALLAGIVLRRARAGFAVYVAVGLCVYTWWQWQVRTAPLGPPPQMDRGEAAGHVASIYLNLWVQLGLAAGVLGVATRFAWTRLRRR